MALQGTLDTFNLTDVLRLLASTRKTGRLRVSGTRGAGSVWLDGGGAVATAATALREGADPVEVIFELLRFRDGTFVFEAEVTTSEAGAPVDVDGLVRDAERLLADWRDIEAVVPGLDAWVALADELPRAEVVVDAERWRVVVAVGAGATVGDLGARFELGELGICRLVKDVVECGLLTVSASAPVGAWRPAAPVPAPVAAAPEVLTAVAEVVPEPVLAPLELEPFAPLVVDEVEVEGDGAEAAEPLDATPVNLGSSPRGELGIEIPGFARLSPRTAFDAPRSGGNDAAEIARQLGNLTPQAAKAIAAAAQAATVEERDAALALATGENDEPLDRGLLLKFLSSVKP